MPDCAYVRSLIMQTKPQSESLGTQSRLLVPKFSGRVNIPIENLHYNAGRKWKIIVV